jgi:pyruvate dehydrogenase E1 component
MRARGLLFDGTSVRTTLNGEGLQHKDGHSHVLASTMPNRVSYDPTYAYELAVIIQAGLKRMYGDNEDITTLNENCAHPTMPEGAEPGILVGMYHVAKGRGRKEAPAPAAPRPGSDPARGQGSGRVARQGFRRIERWSVTSFEIAASKKLTLSADAYG